MAARDFAFEALAEVTNTDWEAGRGELNAALKSIKLQEPDIHDSYLLSCEIHDQAKRYRLVMGQEILLTPSALAKHWKRVKEQAPKPRPTTISPVTPQPLECGTCGGNKIVFVSDELTAPCPDCNSGANADFWRADGSRHATPDSQVVRARMER